MRKFLTLLFAAIIAVAAFAIPAPVNVSTAQAFGDVQYEVTTRVANGRYIKIELRAEGTGLHVTLRKSDPNNLLFTNYGIYRIVGYHPTTGRTFKWDWQNYDGTQTPHQFYSHMIWPAVYLPHGHTEYYIELISHNDSTPKETGRATATTICPYNWRTGLNEC